MTKISTLTALTGASAVAADLFPVVQASAGVNGSKYMLASEVEILIRNLQNSAALVALAGSTSITAATHSSRTSMLNGTGAAYTQTLPAATGSGASYKFAVGAVNSSNHIIAAYGSDKFLGNIVTNKSGVSTSWTATNHVTCTLNGGTSGGAQIGDYVFFQDIAVNKWLVEGLTTSTGTIVTPFA